MRDSNPNTKPGRQFDGLRNPPSALTTLHLFHVLAALLLNPAVLQSELQRKDFYNRHRFKIWAEIPATGRELTSSAQTSWFSKELSVFKLSQIFAYCSFSWFRYDSFTRPTVRVNFWLVLLIETNSIPPQETQELVMLKHYAIVCDMRLNSAQTFLLWN